MMVISSNNLTLWMDRTLAKVHAKTILDVRHGHGEGIGAPLNAFYARTLQELVHEK
jgi:hypothetical protein